jgi:hypothetical protein
VVSGGIQHIYSIAEVQALIEALQTMQVSKINTPANLPLPAVAASKSANQAVAMELVNGFIGCQARRIISILICRYSGIGMISCLYVLLKNLSIFINLIHANI